MTKANNGSGNPRSFAVPQDDAVWERVRTAARPVVCDVELPGIGERCLQLILCRENEDSPAWEIRRFEEDWWLFRSEIAASWPNIELIDYRPIPVEPGMLSSFFSRVIALSLPIAPDFETEGIDGDIWQLAVFGLMESTCRFQWWSQPPRNWKLLADLAAEMLHAFSAAERNSV